MTNYNNVYVGPYILLFHPDIPDFVLEEIEDENQFNVVNVKESEYEEYACIFPKDTIVTFYESGLKKYNWSHISEETEKLFIEMDTGAIKVFKTKYKKMIGLIDYHLGVPSEILYGVVRY